VTMGELPTRLSEIYARRRDKTMFIAGAGTLRYQSIVDVIDAAKGAGVDRVGIITEAMRK
jgi:biopolymer transport protein TolR